MPELYWLSGRAPGGAIVITDFIVGRTAGRADGQQRLADATPGALRQYLDSLYSSPPELFLDTSTAAFRSYGHYPLSLIPPVAAFVHRYYRKIGTVQRITIYTRSARPPLHAPLQIAWASSVKTSSRRSARGTPIRRSRM